MRREKVSAKKLAGKRIKVRALAERPGTPAEGEAAKAALDRLGSGNPRIDQVAEWVTDLEQSEPAPEQARSAAPRPRHDMTITAPNKRKLSDIFIQKLKPRPRPFLVWDTYQRGLALSLQPTGHKSWKCIYSFHGRPRWYHIGAVGAVGLKAARKLASRVMFQVAEGKDPCADRKAERNRGTFEELATRYIEEYAKRKNKSWKQADALVRKNLLPRWAKLQAADISRADVKAAMGRIEAPITANQVLAAASAIFTWAIREEVDQIKVNPCRLVERNNTNQRERVLSDSEIPKFWIAFDCAGLVDSAALKMILLTGQRPGEVRHMRREHIVDGWWEMPGKPVPALDWPGTKNGISHRVWLPAPAQVLLAEMPETALVFAGPRGGAIKGLDAAMRAVCANVETEIRKTQPDFSLEPVKPHDLRRTHGTTITRLKFGTDAMNRIENHKEGGIASVYDQYGYAEDNKKIMEVVAAHIMSLVEGRPSVSNVIELQAART
jgi:integrase